LLLFGYPGSRFPREGWEGLHALGVAPIQIVLASTKSIRDSDQIPLHIPVFIPAVHFDVNNAGFIADGLPTILIPRRFVNVHAGTYDLAGI
jgi:hypothetical protein